VAATKIARRLVDEGRSGVIATIFCDGASKYMSEHFWNDPD